MKKIIAGLAAGAALMIAGTGSALADGYEGVKGKGHYVDRCAPGNRFAGLYLGVAAGTASWRMDRSDVDGFGNGGPLLGQGDQTLTNTTESFTAGVQVGYNFMRCNTLFGIELDWSWTDGDQSRTEDIRQVGIVPVGTRSVSSSMDWLAMLRTRTGIAYENLLFYVTGGIAFADINHSWSRVVPLAGINETFSFGDTRWGWTVGAGTEWAITDRISLKSEFAYIRFQDTSGTFATPVSALNPLGLPHNFQHSDDLWLARVGLNFKLHGEHYAAPLK